MSEDAAHRLRRLQRIVAALAGVLTPSEVATVIMDEISSDVGARPLLWLINNDAAMLEMVDPSRHPPAAGFERIPLDSDLPGAIVARTGRPVFIASRAERIADFPELRSVPTEAGFAALPLVSHERLIGVLAVGFPGPHHFDTDEEAFLSAVATVVATTFDRARLHAVERQATERLTFLAEASNVLAASLDYDDTLRRVVQLIVPRIAGMTTVHLYDDRGDLRRVALAHQDAAIEEALLAYVSQHEYEARSPMLAAATRRGQTMLVADTTPAVSQQAALDAEHERLLKSLDITSSVLVPLVARGETLGVLTFLRVGNQPPYGPDDQALAEELARRAAVAVDNARMHSRRAEVAEALQAGLVPPDLPVVAGVEMAAAYHAAGEGIDAGGDFYEVFPLPDGRYALMIGDVTGTGPTAAALTAQVRHAVHAFAALAAGPAELVGAVNNLLATGMDPERFCTMVFASMTVAAGGVDMDVVNGGHPHPVLVHRDGTAEMLEITGSLLAVVPGVGYHSERVHLGSGDTLLLYTDGVIEAAHDGEYFSEDGLLVAAAGPAERSATAIVDGILQALKDFGGAKFADDVAVLAIQADSG